MYQTIEPPAHLKKYVNYFWQGEILPSEKKSFTHISTAATCPELLFYYKGGFSPANNATFTLGGSAIFHGQTNLHADYLANEEAGIFGVHFFPFALPALFSMPASELTNQMVDLNVLFGNAGAELQEQVFLTATMQERVAIISRFLESKFDLNLENDRHIIAALHTINTYNGAVNAVHLAKQACLSQRQFERKFKELSGFTPKSYAKIVRFEFALNCFLHNPQSFTDLALSCGYYDQAHFNHDFKTLSGYTPKEYHQNYLDTMD
jgi:AraC-like DNA-binding protein